MILTSYNNMNSNQQEQLFRIIRSKISDSDWREMLIDLISPCQKIYESKTKDLVLFPQVIKALKSGNKTELKEVADAAYNAKAASYAAYAVYYAAHAAAYAASNAYYAVYAAYNATAKQKQQQILLKYLRLPLRSKKKVVI